MSLAYYNENDPKAAAWLRELIKAGHIAPGEVDDRSIDDVQPSDLEGFAQCHFFAGIGGWSYALRLAGWPDDRAVWTGSCPCQPFSLAGKGCGFTDERHLWPAWFHLVRECKPSIIFGEQVANALSWFDLISTDLEGEGYTCRAAIIGAHSVGAPHIRQRLYFVADTDNSRLEGRPSDSAIYQSDREPHWAHCVVVCDSRNDARPIEPSTLPLVDGIPHRVGLLRGYGNAIVPQVAAEFITAYSTAQRVSKP